jgi:hypothetical protein
MHKSSGLISGMKGRRKEGRKEEGSKVGRWRKGGRKEGRGVEEGRKEGRGLLVKFQVGITLFSIQLSFCYTVVKDHYC